MGDNVCIGCGKQIPEGSQLCPLCDPFHPVRKNKYGAEKMTVDGIVFDSRKEARRYHELKLMEKAGAISDVRRQVRYTLIPAQKDEKGRSLERECAYIADFVYTENGKTVVEDTKSPATRTKEYIIKRKLMLYVHGIRIKEV